MVSKYLYKLPETNAATSVTQVIQAGPLVVNLDLQWAIASDEQYSMIMKQFAQYAQSDPLIMPDGSSNRTYSYLLYYYDLSKVNLNEFLDNPKSVLPMSIKGHPRYFQLSQLQKRITVCVNMMPIVSQYIEVLRWQARVKCNNEVTIAVVQPGGWYRNQDDLFSFRFVSDLSYIGKDDLNTVTMEMEIYG